MKSKITQTDAVNQVGLYKSHNNEITIITDPRESMAKYIREGDLEKAVDILSDIYKLAESMHPLYPLYSYKPIKIGGGIHFEHIPANEAVAKSNPISYKGSLTLKSKDFLEGETVSEYMWRKYYSQETIDIDVKYLETWIGETLIENSLGIEQTALKDGKWSIVPSNLPAPIKSKLVFIEGGNEIVVLDYLEIGVVGTDSTTGDIIIGNLNQLKCPINISFVIPKSFSLEDILKTPTKFKFKIREEFLGKVFAEKTLQLFIYSVLKNLRMELIDIERQKMLFSASQITFEDLGELEEVKERMNFLDVLYRIEKYFNVELTLPEKITDEDDENIEILLSVVEEKEVIRTFKDLSLNINEKQALELLVNDIKESAFMLTATIIKEIELLGVKFPKLNGDYKIENIATKFPGKVKKKLEAFDEGDIVKVQFKPGTRNEIITKYYL